MQLIFILISSFLQGISDPLIRKSSTGIEKVQGESLITTKLGELKFLITNLNVNIFLSKKNLLDKNMNFKVFSAIFLESNWNSIFLYNTC